MNMLTFFCQMKCTLVTALLTLMLQPKSILGTEIINHHPTLRQRDLIKGGDLATFGEFPSFAFVRKTDTENNMYFAGSLIHPDVILTAGVFPPNYTVVSIGGIKVDGSDGEVVGTRLFVSHPEYDSKFKNSIQLVFLNTTSTKPIQKLNFDESIPKKGDQVTMIGYGREGTDADLYNGTLRKVQYAVDNMGYNAIPFISLLGPQRRKRFVFAGARGAEKGMCKGDLGGPLINDDDIQVGIALAYTLLGCGTRNLVPDVYVRVSLYKSFIEENVCKYSNVKPSYCT